MRTVVIAFACFGIVLASIASAQNDRSKPTGDYFQNICQDESCTVQVDCSESRCEEGFTIEPQDSALYIAACSSYGGGTATCRPVGVSRERLVCYTVDEDGNLDEQYGHSCSCYNYSVNDNAKLVVTVDQCG